MRRRRPTLPDVLFSIGTAVAIGGALLAFRAWWLGPAIVLAALSPFLEWRTLPPALARRLQLVLHVALALAFVALWFTRPMPLILDQESAWIPRALASVLATLAMVFALTRPRFPDGRTLVPAVVGLLVVTGAIPAPAGFGASSVAAFGAAGHNAFAELYVGLVVIVAVILWSAILTVEGPRLGGRSGRGVLPILLALGLFAAGVLGLPAAQPRVEQAMAEAMNPKAATGLSSGATLGDFGELAVSRRRVLDLRASNPNGAWLLRGEALCAFDGRRWSNVEDPRSLATVLGPLAGPVVDDPLLASLGSWFRPVPAGPADGARLRITQHAFESWPLLLPKQLAFVSAAAPSLEQDGHGFVHRARGSAAALYGAVLTTRPPKPPPLAADERARNLALPPGLDPRIAALGASLAPAGAQARERLGLTVAHLQTNYRYTLSPGRFRPNGDPVAEFLFEKKQAYCEYFATAAVLLLRAQGVPARFVKGLSVGAHNHYGGDLFVVREADAHAWVEAYLPGEGWVEADPTPGADFAATHAPPGRWSQAMERVRAVLAEAWARLTGEGLFRLLRRALAVLAAVSDGLRRPWVLALLVPVVAGMLLFRRMRTRWREWRARRGARRNLAVPAELLRAIDEIEQRWRRAGHPRPRSRGLREHASLRVVARQAPPADDPDLRLIDRYYAVRFGGGRRS